MASAPGLRTEIVRRKSLTTQLEEYLKARPGEWVTMRELAAVGGLGGWRTRLSELGRRSVDPLTIEHNRQNGAASCHRYLPATPLGRDASMPVADRWPIAGAPAYAEPFELTPPEARE